MNTIRLPLIQPYLSLSLPDGDSHAIHFWTVKHQEWWSCDRIGGTCVANAENCLENLAESVDCPEGWCCFGGK